MPVRRRPSQLTKTVALEDLARFEGSDPQLSLFRRRLDGTLAIAGARLGAAQQAAVEINPSGVRLHRGGDWAVASPPPIHRPTRGASRGLHVLHLSGWGPPTGRG
eukprot:scaffold10171_cov140-Isochrysis_galbana.AAC.1